MVSGSVMIISQYFFDDMICEVVSREPNPFSIGSLVIGHLAFSSFLLLLLNSLPRIVMVIKVNYTTVDTSNAYNSCMYDSKNHQNVTEGGLSVVELMKNVRSRTVLVHLWRLWMVLLVVIEELLEPFCWELLGYYLLH